MRGGKDHPMLASRKPNAFGSAPLRASNHAGQHAVEAWENEGGPSGVLGDERSRTRADSIGSVTRGSTRDTPKEALDEEDRILRSLGAAVIMRWNTIPTKLQKELFEDASSIGELLQADVLKGQIARFLHKHKDDAA
jgi:hypothetical protein